MKLHIIVFILAVATNTIASNRNAAWNKTDSWYRAPENAWYSEEITSDGEVFLIDPKAELKAEQLLENVTHLKISDETFHSLVSTPAKTDGSKRLFLVRGVTLNPKHGKFSIRQSGKEIVISNGCLGRSPAPMIRKPVVVSLSFDPEQVFTTCGMDE